MTAFGVLFAAGAMRDARADIIVYTDRATFEAASTGLTTIDFEGLAPVDSFQFFASPPGLDVGGVNFQSLGDTLFVLDPGYAPPLFEFVSGQYLQDNFGGGLAVTLTPAATAVGTDLSAFAAGSVRILLSTGDELTVEISGQPNYAFFGVTSDVAIASMLFTSDTGDAVTIDNFSVGSRGVVPEPASVAMLGTGALAMLGYARRRRAATA